MHPGRQRLESLVYQAWEKPLTSAERQSSTSGGRGRRFSRPALAALLGCLVAASAARAGAPVDEAPVNDIAFADAKVGMAVGDGGLILLTTDGGNTWRNSPSGTGMHLLAVALAGERVAYAAGGVGLGPDAGSAGVLLKTESGGAAWRAVARSPSRLWGVSARDQSVAAWCEPCPETPGGLLVSSDGGETWTAASGDLTLPILAMHWSTADSGYVVTADGLGRRWDKGALIALPNQNPPGRLTAAHLMSPDAWVAALETGQVAVTRDAGRSWQPAAIDGAAAACGARDFSFCSPTEGWFAAAGPAGIQLTTDSGSRWKRIGTSPAGPLRAAWFRSAWSGLVAGPFGTLYRTGDGGRTWDCVRGRPRRAALVVVEPYGSVGDWPLVSMLCADRGYRTLLWWATVPSGESLLVRERRLRDAAWALVGAEAMILGPERSARLDGPPGFGATAAMPRGRFEARHLPETTTAVTEIARLWRPAVLLSTSGHSPDAEEAFVGSAAEQAAEAAGLRHWVADPLNETGERLPGSESDYDIPLNPLTASEEFGLFHGPRAQMAAQLARDWPAPLAEALGYRRTAADDADPHPTALLRDLPADDAATRRDVGATARVALALREKWQKDAAAFFPQFKVDLMDGDFATALRRADEFTRQHPQMQLGPSSLADLMAAAAGAGDLPAAQRAADSLVALGQAWPPRVARAALWLLDYHASAECRLGGEPAARGLSEEAQARLRTLRGVLWLVAARRFQAPDVQFQWARLNRTGETLTTDELDRLRPAVAASADPRLAALIELERWIAGGSRDAAPIPLADLAASGTKEEKDKAREITLGESVALEVDELAGGLVLRLDEQAARSWWLTVDVDRDGRTVLAEPFVAEDEPPSQTTAATASPPVWVRRPKVWRRDARDGRLALQLRYDDLGGRPKAGTVWLLALLHQEADGQRPGPSSTLHHAGCFAVRF